MVHIKMEIKKTVIKSFLLCTVFIFIFNIGANDVILNGTSSSTWSSVIFTIPVNPPFKEYQSFFEKNSFYYCLTLFRLIRFEPNLPAIEHQHINAPIIMTDPYEGFAKMKESALEQCNVVFEPSYKKHNFFVIRDGCCQGQFVWYFNFGFKEALLTPSEYFERITDYSENNKRLNYLVAYYDIDCDVNIITKIGFGEGRLMRHYLTYKYSRQVS